MSNDHEAPVVLITGAARRIGAAIARRFHADGYRVALHYRARVDDARALKAELDARRADAAELICAELGEAAAAKRLCEEACEFWGGLDVLVNNASSFIAGDLDSLDEAQWRQSLDADLKGAAFLCAAAAPHLRERGGAVVNIGDALPPRTRRRYFAYSVAKGGLHALTRSAALALAPSARANTLSLGFVLSPNSPDADGGDEEREMTLPQVPLGRNARLREVAATALFLAKARYISGQNFPLDGGAGLQPTP